MAGCEAMISADRSWIISWLEKGSKKSPTTGFNSCIGIMREVWRGRDAAPDLDGGRTAAGVDHEKT